MQARTYTSLWRVERRIYRIYDVSLPYAVSIRQLAVFAGIVAIWIPIMILLGVPPTTWWGAVLWLTPPFGAAYLANRPIIENKTFSELLASELRYQLTPKRSSRLQPWPDTKDTQHLSATLWRR